MSSENRDKNCNDNLETRQGKPENKTAQKKCDTNASGTVQSVTGLGEKGAKGKVDASIAEKPCSFTYEQAVSKQLAMDQNLNAFKEGATESNKAGTITNPVKDCGKSLNNASVSCEKPIADRNVPSKKCPDKLIRDTLIHKVNELDISGRVNQNVQNNKSTVILKKETDSLKNLLVYDNSSDDDDEFEKNWQFLTVPDSCSDSETESDDSIDESSDDDTDDISSHIIFGEKEKGAIKKDSSRSGDIIKACGDDVHRLPPLPDLSNLSINYEREEFLHMGHVQAIIDTLVTVEAIPGTPAYDLDSYLFVEDKTFKRPLGAIYDVIGPVTAPIYCIRFNTTKDIQDLNIKQGLKVFSAPKSQYTHYVFVKELMKHRGTDASWVGDGEIPPEVAAEISDEEDDHNLQNARKAQKRKHGSLERHKQFEKSMNRCNTLNTRVAQLVDAHRRLPRPVRYNDHPQRALASDLCTFANRLPAPFDPTVPPPGFHDLLRQNDFRTPGQWGWPSQEAYRPPVGPPPNAAPFIHGQNNSANYYTNNAGRSHAAGPSTQPY